GAIARNARRARLGMGIAAEPGGGAGARRRPRLREARRSRGADHRDPPAARRTPESASRTASRSASSGRRVRRAAVGLLPGEPDGADLRTTLVGGLGLLA